MGLVIKFPTLITEPSNDGFVNQITMIDNAKGILERYNNRNEDERLVIQTRGKTKEKVIKIPPLKLNVEKNIACC